MLKVGTLIAPVHQEPCYAHCLQLAILDVLYDKPQTAKLNSFFYEY